MRYFEISNTGRVRRNNQDRVLADEQLGLWIVADGMGGHAGGAEASRLACEAVNEGVLHGMPLGDAFEVAHSRVRSAQEDDPSLHDMGTTLVAVREHNGSYELAWVGDSRIYRYNSKGSEFECLTRDQNVAGRLVETGRITADQAREHPQRHILTDCIGQREGLPTIESTRIDWRNGDRLLLCSDGLNSELSDAEMKQWLANLPCPRAAAEKLTEQALEAGGKDNVSLIILEAPASA
ncbi:MAG TPA: protein phosphatase 2C domain-containing protein [Wenzhouxiangellaceae bacterium]|nr:protein phosphatase 2C domain-containing protein [Wenzhouxiangellaceae bacterium]